MRSGETVGYMNTTVNLEAVKLLVQKCLDNAEALLDSAKDCRTKNRNHIAFHLAVLALEEVGKASMSLVKTVVPHVDHEEDSDGSRLSDDLADHKKKLFWAMMIPDNDEGIISPEDFIRLKEIANDIHVRRITSLYANTDDPASQTDISNAELTRIIALTEARLGLEKLKEIRQPDADAQELLDWFMGPLSDPQMQPVLLGEQSRQKLAEFTGDARKWMTWLREEISTAETKTQEMMEKEINRLAPTGILANKPKWRLKIKLHTLSHSIRQKELNGWNEQVKWVKLYPTTNKTELLVEFLLPAKIPVTELWQNGIQMCGMFAVSLNIATMGYFWWYLPEFVTTFYEELVDLETKAKLAVDYRQPVMGNWKRTALKATQLNIAGMILSYLMMWATKEQSLACSRYMNGIAHLSKNDMFGDFTGQAFVEFAQAFRMAITSFGGWDGTPETFDQVFSAIYNNPEVVGEFKALIDSADAFEKKQPPSRPINLENAFKLKALCDGYFITRIRLEFQNRRQRESSEKLADDTGPVGTSQSAT
jgi:AbiV family abortive infection protein